ncbi:MAG TPA: hypothetical protein VKM55_15645 [Candidatus Lokiarchaeia archaeon]|nr:hypothetical protein [Candidatus Lokiarchaeia archaeon]
MAFPLPDNEQQLKIFHDMLASFNCKTCAMTCRYFTRVECERRKRLYWEPADRSRCEGCRAWHSTKQCCYRHDERCLLLDNENNNYP